MGGDRRGLLTPWTVGWPIRYPPTAEEVANALRSIFPAATECAHGAHGINVSLTFVPAGSVGTVNVTGASDDAVRDCIVRAVRGGHVPAYTGPPRDANFAL